MSKPIQWLLESDEPWTRYRTEVDLLDWLEDDPEVAEARRETFADERIRDLVASLRDEELSIPAICGENVITHIKPDSFYWVLCFLGEIDLTKDDLGLDEVVESLFDLQAPDDYFASVRQGDKPVCLVAVLCYSLARLGYLDDSKVQACYEHLL